MHVGRAGREHHVGPVVLHRTDHPLHVAPLDQPALEQRPRGDPDRVAPVVAAHAHLDALGADEVAHRAHGTALLRAGRVGAQEVRADLRVGELHDLALDALYLRLAQQRVDGHDGHVAQAAVCGGDHEVDLVSRHVVARLVLGHGPDDGALRERVGEPRHQDGARRQPEGAHEEHLEDHGLPGARLVDGVKVHGDVADLRVVEAHAVALLGQAHLLEREVVEQGDGDHDLAGELALHLDVVAASVDGGPQVRGEAVDEVGERVLVDHVQLAQGGDEVARDQRRLVVGSGARAVHQPHAGRALGKHERTGEAPLPGLLEDVGEQPAEGA